MRENLTESVRRSVWWGWGDPALAKPLSDGARQLLADELGVDGTPVAPPVELDAVDMPEPRLDAAALTALRTACADVRTDRAERAAHSGGKSYPDLYRRRTGDCSAAPDAVCCPGSEDEIAALLAICAQRGIAVVPYGGGTSVVGGLEPLAGTHAAVVSLDLQHLAGVVRVSETDRVVVVQPGIRGPELEAALAPHGLTLGHVPQSYQQATIGGYVATRSAGQASTGYGRSDELVQRVRIVTPSGVIDAGGTAPATAAGPGLRDLLVGSEGVFGVISEVTMRVAAAPEKIRPAAWSFSSFAVGAEALRAAGQRLGHDQLPAVCRLSDEEETRVALAMSSSSATGLLRRYLGMRGHDSAAMGIFLWEGDHESTGFAKHRCESVFAEHGGVRLGPMVATSWEHGRFGAPYLRDELMTYGMLVETLETAASWSGLMPTYAAVQRALTDTLGDPSSVQCHISHVYDGGASLYFTFLAPAADDPLEQWRRAKTAASEAIVAAGATITHHHAVGADHAPYLPAEVGDLGIDVLRAVKDRLDPAGIMNPGKLLPSEAGR